MTDLRQNVAGARKLLLSHDGQISGIGTDLGAVSFCMVEVQTEIENVSNGGGTNFETASPNCKSLLRNGRFP